jgi:predicted dehydrogenase
MSIKVGICGIGRIASDDHLPALKRIKDFSLIGVYDVTPARRRYAEDMYKVKTYSDLEEFLNLGIDLVIISSPSNTHKSLAAKVINKGINVIVEKPIALNSKDAKFIIELAKKKRVLLSVYHNRRWDRDFITIQRLLNDHKIGKPLVIESRAISFGSLSWYAVKEFDPWWRYKRSYNGGVLLDFGTHLIDQVLQLVKSEPESIWCNMKSVIWSREVEVYFKCILRFKNDLIAQLETSQISRYTLPRWHIIGTHGAIVCDDWWNGPVKIKYTNSEYTEGREHIYKFKDVKKDIFYTNILRALQKKESLLVKPDEVYNVMVVIDAARKSAQIGKEVRIRF